MDNSKTSITAKLTKRVIDAASPAVRDGKTRQRVVWDTELKGFGLLVGAQSKSFIVQRDIHGRTIRITLGRVGLITAEQARKDALGTLGLMAKNIHPEEAKRRAAIRTLRGALEHYITTRRENGRSEETLHGYRKAVETYLANWLDRPLAEIDRQAVFDRHRKIAVDVGKGKFANGRTRTEANGRYTANATMRALRAIYNDAMTLDDSLPLNPCIGLRKKWFKEQRREAAIPSDQIHQWYTDVMALENPIRRDYLRFVLFTGLRRESAASIRWEHVDVKQKALHVAVTKGDHPFDLPLPDFLVDMLRARKSENEKFFPDSPWVFPSKSASGHIAEPKEKLSVPFSVHGLRNTFVTTAESLDLSHYVIKALVNHSLPKDDVTGGYVQHELERLRPAMQEITDRLLLLCSSKKSKIVKFKRKARANVS